MQVLDEEFPRARGIAEQRGDLPVYLPANGALLFAALLALTRKAWPGFLVAALFAVHPMHVESVAWISERKDVLCALLAFLSAGAWLRSGSPGTRESPCEVGVGVGGSDTDLQDP